MGKWSALTQEQKDAHYAAKKRRRADGREGRTQERLNYAPRQQELLYERVLRARLFILEYISDKVCVDCGESDFRTFEFDHRPDEKKVANISELIQGGRLNKIKEEITKCDVVCANCHRIRSFERENSYRHSAYKVFCEGM